MPHLTDVTSIRRVSVVETILSRVDSPLEGYFRFAGFFLSVHMIENSTDFRRLVLNLGLTPDINRLIFFKDNR